MAKIALLHGYLLDGSGSNLWTQNVARSLVRDFGHEVHLICQEPHPEKYLGDIEGIHFHRPDLGGTLPVYVMDKYEGYERVAPVTELSDSEIENYIKLNEDAITEIVKKNKIDHIFSNHVVLISVAAERVSESTGVPYSVIPHGSAIEYAVKKDDRLKVMATNALENATAVLTVNNEMDERLENLFNITDTLQMPVGVDLDAFVVADSKSKEKMFEAFSNLKFEDIEKSPDKDILEKLQSIDWDKPVVAFVGRFIDVKGPQYILEGLEGRGHQILMLGHGPLRNELESRGGAVFTGYLPHDLLKFVLPCLSVAVFPSTVPEVGPMTMIEALACGIYSMGVDQAGINDICNQFSSDIDTDGMRLSNNPKTLPTEICEKVESALASPVSRELLRSVIVKRYGWRKISEVMISVI